ncbi:hypothetical protein DV20_11985 [Amycolatopsis rifamycinica]|uniref:DUF3558 domain-containing protein n=1 Tax=Amycolatopsis rifamycinica TaxID=287986 RepID=A0A066U4S2_9PSEU|nr:hypothetical protein DV20_11985 [Amycolatopsis rifamycinica]
MIACATLLSVSLLAGCGSPKSQRLLSQPPTPAQTGAALPLDQVPTPVDLAKFDSDPCGLLTKEQAAAVVADPPDGIRATRRTTLPAFGCTWMNPPGALMAALKPVQSPKTLTELSTSPLKKSGELEPWTETSISGLPAVVYHQFGSTAECSISVEVTAEQMLTFEIEGKDLPGSYWDTDRCGGVAKMAEFVIGNLR